MSGPVSVSLPSFCLSHLVQCGQAIGVGRIDVGSLLQQSEHLVPFAGQASGQKHTARREFDATPGLVLGVVRFASGVRLLPASQLLGPLRHGRVVTHFERHGGCPGGASHPGGNSCVCGL